MPYVYIVKPMWSATPSNVPLPPPLVQPESPTLVLLGDTNTGKTSSALYYITGQSSPTTASTKERRHRKTLTRRAFATTDHKGSTGSKGSKNENSPETITIEIVDTSGSWERVSPMRGTYHKTADAFALFYSVYDNDTWLRMVREYMDIVSSATGPHQTPPILVIGTFHSYSPLRVRKVSRQQARDFSFRHHVPMMEVDLSQGVDIIHAYDQIVRRMISEWTKRTESAKAPIQVHTNHGKWTRKLQKLCCCS